MPISAPDAQRIRELVPQAIRDVLRADTLPDEAVARSAFERAPWSSADREAAWAYWIDVWRVLVSGTCAKRVRILEARLHARAERVRHGLPERAD